MAKITIKTRNVAGNNGMSYVDVGLFIGKDCIMKTRFTVGRFVSIGHSVMASSKMIQLVKEQAGKPATEQAQDDEFYVDLSDRSGVTGPWNLQRPSQRTNGNGNGDGNATKREVLLKVLAELL